MEKSHNSLVHDSIFPLIKEFQHIGIDTQKVLLLAERLKPLPESNWDLSFILNKEITQTINYLAIFVLTSFYYWQEPIWYFRYNDLNLNGSYGLLAAYKKIIEDGIDLTKPEVISKLTLEEFSMLTRGVNDIEIPMIEKRLELLQSYALILQNKYDGNIINLYKKCNFDAQAIVNTLAEEFEVFSDEYSLDGNKVYFFKKAQELVSMSHEINNNSKQFEFKNMESLTASSDYKLPQVLHASGALIYKPDLLANITNKTPLVDGSREVIEIRAATVYIAQMISKLTNMPEYVISNKLWTYNQDAKFPITYPRIISTVV